MAYGRVAQPPNTAGRAFADHFLHLDRAARAQYVGIGGGAQVDLRHGLRGTSTRDCINTQSFWPYVVHTHLIHFLRGR